MAEPRCALTELLTSMCAHCLGQTEPKPTRTLGQWFSAAFPGRCECGERIEPGDRIRADWADDGGYLGECCMEDHDG